MIQSEGFLVVRAGSVDISPPEELIQDLEGFGGRVLTGIDDPLEANVLLLRLDEGDLALVTVDLLYPGTALRQALADRLHGDQPNLQLLLFASHTHQAPAVELNRPRLGRGDTRYVEVLAERISVLVRQLLDRSPTGCAMRFGVADSDAGVSRRLPRLLSAQQGRIRLRGCAAAPNPNASIDRQLAFVEFVGPDDQPLALLWSLACHPVEYPWRDRISADFPGVVREAMRQQLGIWDLPVLFLQGFSGDVRPNVTQRPGPVRNPIRRLLQGSGFPRATELEYRSWCSNVVRDVTAARSRATLLAGGRVRTSQWATPLTQFCKPPGDGDVVSFSAVSIGDALQLLGVSAEPVSEYALDVRARAPHAVITAGCMDHTFGYAATAEMFQRGGYEADGFARFFEIRNMRPTVQAVLQSGFTRVLEASG